jgi:hypothetical protein
MDHSKIKDVVIGAAPFLAGVIQKWSNSGLSNFELTSVGMAIAHANIKRAIGNFAPLSIWLDEATAGG